MALIPPPLTVLSPVSSYILPDDSKASRQKTRTVKKSLSPVFNHTMVYDGFQAKDLAEACAEFTIWDQDTFSKQRLGGIRLSLGTGKATMESWGGLGIVTGDQATPAMSLPRLLLNPSVLVAFTGSTNQLFLQLSSTSFCLS